MPTMRITKGRVDRLPHPDRGQQLYWDETLKGFGVLVSKTTKSYVAQGKVKRRSCRTTIGRHGPMTTEQARKAAKTVLARMAAGEDPNRPEVGNEGATLQVALERYVDSPAKRDRSPRTLKGYRYFIEHYLSDWLDRPLSTLTKPMVADRHLKLGREHGEYTANGVMRALRAVWRHARRRDDTLPEPATTAVDWFPERRRDWGMAPEDLAGFRARLEAKIGNPVMRDLQLMMLFTGLRPESACSIRWEDVDLETGTLRVPKPKGGEKRAFDLPLSNFLLELLAHRREQNEVLVPGSPWVFPSTRKPGDRVREPNLHKKHPDLPQPSAMRHTYVSAAMNRVGLHPIAVKLLVNHTVPNSDVTAGYVTPDTEALRRDQQQMTDFLRAQLWPEGDNVVKLEDRQRG